MSDDTPAETPKKTAARKASPKKAAAKKADSKKTTPKKTGAKRTGAKKAGAAKPDGRSTGSLSVPSTRHFPVQMFASVLGIAGLGLAWRETAQTFGFTDTVGELFLGFAAGFYVAVLALYTLKAFRHPDAAMEDFADPIRGCYFSAAGMGLLLFSSAALPHSPWLAEALWLFGAPVTLAITVALVAGWMAREFEIHHATPVWFLPIAGNLLAAIAGGPLGYTDISWMIFAIGLVLWLVLLVIIFYRLLFHDPLEQPVRPTIVIMLMPPALAFIAYAVLSGGYLDGFAMMLFGLMLFVGVLLAVQAPMLIRLPFGFSNWSYSFPLAAVTVAASLYADQRDSVVADLIAIAALAGVTLITIWLFARTAKALIGGELFRAPVPAAEAEEDREMIRARRRVPSARPMGDTRRWPT